MKFTRLSFLMSATLLASCSTRSDRNAVILATNTLDSIATINKALASAPAENTLKQRLNDRKSIFEDQYKLISSKMETSPEKDSLQRRYNDLHNAN